MSKNWIDIYEDFARTHSSAIAKSGYLIDGQPISEAVFESWYRFLKSHLKINTTTRILDVGCGAGVFLKMFSQDTTNLWGVDTSEAQLASAKNEAKTAQLMKSDALGFPVEGNSFDLIFCNSVFLLFPSLDYAYQVLSHFASAVAPEGIIWIGDVPTANAEVDKDFRRVGKSSTVALQHYPESFFADFAEKNGFIGKKVSQEIEGKGNSAYRYDYMLKKRA